MSSKRRHERSGVPQGDQHKLWLPTERQQDSDSDHRRYKQTTTAHASAFRHHGGQTVDARQTEGRPSNRDRGYKSDGQYVSNSLPSSHQYYAGPSSRTLHHAARIPSAQQPAPNQLPSSSSAYHVTSSAPTYQQPPPSRPQPPRAQTDAYDPRIHTHKRAAPAPTPQSSYEKVSSAEEGGGRAARQMHSSRSGHPSSQAPPASSAALFWTPPQELPPPIRRHRDRDRDRDRDREKDRDTDTDRDKERQRERQRDKYDRHREREREKEKEKEDPYSERSRYIDKRREPSAEGVVHAVHRNPSRISLSARDGQQSAVREPAPSIGGHRRHRTEEGTSSTMGRRQHTENAPNPPTTTQSRPVITSEPDMVAQQGAPGEGHVPPPAPRVMPVYLPPKPPKSHRSHQERYLAAAAQGGLSGSDTERASIKQRTSERGHSDAPSQKPAGTRERTQADFSSSRVEQRSKPESKYVLPQSSEHRHPAYPSTTTPGVEIPLITPGIPSSSLPPVNRSFGGTVPQFVSIRAGQGPSDPQAYDTSYKSPAPRVDKPQEIHSKPAALVPPPPPPKQSNHERTHSHEASRPRPDPSYRSHTDVTVLQTVVAPERFPIHETTTPVGPFHPASQNLSHTTTNPDPHTRPSLPISTSYPPTQTTLHAAPKISTTATPPQAVTGSRPIRSASHTSSPNERPPSAAPGSFQAPVPRSASNHASVPPSPALQNAHGVTHAPLPHDAVHSTRPSPKDLPRTYSTPVVSSLTPAHLTPVERSPHMTQVAPTTHSTPVVAPRMSLSVSQPPTPATSQAHPAPMARHQPSQAAQAMSSQAYHAPTPRHQPLQASQATPPQVDTTSTQRYQPPQAVQATPSQSYPASTTRYQPPQATHAAPLQVDTTSASRYYPQAVQTTPSQTQAASTPRYQPPQAIQATSSQTPTVSAPKYQPPQAIQATPSQTPTISAPKYQPPQAIQATPSQTPTISVSRYQPSQDVQATASQSYPASTPRYQPPQATQATPSQIQATSAPKYQPPQAVQAAPSQTHTVSTPRHQPPQAIQATPSQQAGQYNPNESTVKSSWLVQTAQSGVPPTTSKENNIDAANRPVKPSQHNPSPSPGTLSRHSQLREVLSQDISNSPRASVSTPSVRHGVIPQAPSQRSSPARRDIRVGSSTPQATPLSNHMKLNEYPAQRVHSTHPSPQNTAPTLAVPPADMSHSRRNYIPHGQTDSGPGPTPTLPLTPTPAYQSAQGTTTAGRVRSHGNVEPRASNVGPVGHQPLHVTTNDTSAAIPRNWSAGHVPQSTVAGVTASFPNRNSVHPPSQTTPRRESNPLSPPSVHAPGFASHLVGSSNLPPITLADVRSPRPPNALSPAMEASEVGAAHKPDETVSKHNNLTGVPGNQGTSGLSHGYSALPPSKDNSSYAPREALPASQPATSHVHQMTINGTMQQNRLHVDRPNVPSTPYPTNHSATVQSTSQTMPRSLSNDAPKSRPGEPVSSPTPVSIPDASRSQPLNYTSQNSRGPTSAPATQPAVSSMSQTMQRSMSHQPVPRSSERPAEAFNGTSTVAQRLASYTNNIAGQTLNNQHVSSSAATVGVAPIHHASSNAPPGAQNPLNVDPSRKPYTAHPGLTPSSSALPGNASVPKGSLLKSHGSDNTTHHESNRTHELLSSTSRITPASAQLYPTSHRSATSAQNSQPASSNQPTTNSHHRTVSLPVAAQTPVVSSQKQHQPSVNQPSANSVAPSAHHKLPPDPSASGRAPVSGHPSTLAPPRSHLPAQVSRTASGESELLKTPSSLAPSMLHKVPVTRSASQPPRTREPSLEDKDPKKKGAGFFGGLFRAKSTSVKPQDEDPTPGPTLSRTTSRQQAPELMVLANVKPSKMSSGSKAKFPTSESEAVTTPVATTTSAHPTARLKAKAPAPLTIPPSAHTPRERKDSASKVFSPFKFLTSKRHQTVSAASLEAMDGTASNTAVGSPTQSTASQIPPVPLLTPPPLRDPIQATHEWIRGEEADLVGRRKGRRRRPGVTFDVEEEPAPANSNPVGRQGKAKLVRRNTGRQTSR